MADVTNLLNFASMVDKVDDYAYFVIFVAAIIFLFKVFTGRAKKSSGEGALSLLKKAGQGGNLDESLEEGAKSPSWRERRKILRAAQREKTRLLSEYIEEKKEVKLLNALAAAIEDFKSQTPSKISTAGKKTEFIDKWNKVTSSASDAAKEFKRLKRVTFRQERQSDRLIKLLKEAKVKKKIITRAETYERDILANHDKLSTDFAALHAGLKGVGKSDVNPVSSASPPINVPDFKSKLQSVLALVGTAKRDQTTAYREVLQLINYFRKYWKP